MNQNLEQKSMIETEQLPWTYFLNMCFGKIYQYN